MYVYSSLPGEHAMQVSLLNQVAQPGVDEVVVRLNSECLGGQTHTRALKTTKTKTKNDCYSCVFI